MGQTKSIESQRWFAVLCLVIFVGTAFFIVDSIAFPSSDRISKLPAAVFFTIQSNIFVGIWALWLGLKALVVNVPSVPSALSLMLTVYMSVTGLVYWLVLTPMLGFVPSLFSASNIWMHTVTPIFTLISFFYILRGKNVSLGSAVMSLIYPLAYMVFSYVVYAMYQQYTYPFLDPALVGQLGVIGSIAGVGSLVAGLSFLYRRRWNRFRTIAGDVVQEQPTAVQM